MISIKSQIIKQIEYQISKRIWNKITKQINRRIWRRINKQIYSELWWQVLESFTRPDGEMANTEDLKSSAVRLEGSSPSRAT